ncbi:hypothetical protein [Actinomadura nitritigenes]|uniref:hypothetical protein n=1 Tax=Actinomadura nitritigenes TaxID=134602 RepID=UPI003D8FFB98
MSLADAISLCGNGAVLMGFFYALIDIFKPHLSPEAKSLCAAWYAAGWWLFFLAEVMKGEPFWSTVDGTIAALYTRSWWNNRPKGRGRKALRELGDKSRRRIQALVDNLTPSPVPSPAGG